MRMLEELYKELLKSEEQIVEWRRYLHQNPELSFQETRTARFIADHLVSFGLEVKEGVGGNGILAYLRGGAEGPTIAFRADFDALPIQDEKDVPYKSQVPGVMHACGHDGHTSALLGVARVLSGVRDRLKGNIVFIFQHAEELPPGGAKGMIEAGALEGVDAVYGIHLASDLPLGKIGLKEGPAMAAADAFTVQIFGKGGHGAMPHTTVDSIVVGCQVVNGLQQIVSRYVNPIQPAVVSVGVFQAGNAFNVIADKTKLQGTVRTFDKSLRAEIEQEIRTIIGGITAAYHAGHEIEYTNGYPPVVNAPEETARVQRLIQSVYGEDALLTLNPQMGAEDFAYYLEQRPGAFFHVGARNDDERTHYAHHHPRFDIDERALLISGKMFLALALDYLTD